MKHGSRKTKSYEQNKIEENRETCYMNGDRVRVGKKRRFVSMLTIFHVTFKTRFQSDHVVVLIGTKKKKA